MSLEECLRKLNKYVSPDGALAIEDQSHEALGVFMASCGKCIKIGWDHDGNVYSSLSNPSIVQSSTEKVSISLEKPTKYAMLSNRGDSSCQNNE